ncbi:MAG: hypothetical protein ACLP50_06370 [Solirubrobacteraceae bacterium]
MYEAGDQFHEDLERIERRTLTGIDLVVAQLDGALDAVRDQDVEMAGLVPRRPGRPSRAAARHGGS